MSERIIVIRVHIVMLIEQLIPADGTLSFLLKRHIEAWSVEDVSLVAFETYDWVLRSKVDQADDAWNS